MSELLRVIDDAITKDTVLSKEIKIKYPLTCGCAGPNYVSMCQAHQQLAREDHARRLGMVAPRTLSDPPHCPTCACAAIEEKGALGEKIAPA